MNKGKKLISLFLFVLLSFSLCGAALAQGGSDIIVLYTNDTHCAVYDSSASRALPPTARSLDGATM
jgi:hypothetical protein